MFGFSAAIKPLATHADYEFFANASELASSLGSIATARGLGGVSPTTGAKVDSEECYPK